MALMHVQGLAELQRAMHALPAKLEGNLVRGALRAGSKVIVDDAQRRVPVASGKLRDSIRATVRINRRAGRVEAAITAGRRTAGKAAPWYARLVEQGTQRHRILPRKARALALAAGGRPVVAVDHPGARARPFMAPALQTKAGAALDAFAAYLRRRIPAELGKR